MTQVEGEGVDQHPNQREEVDDQGGLSEKTGNEYQSLSGMKVINKQHTLFVGYTCCFAQPSRLRNVEIQCNLTFHECIRLRFSMNV